MVHPARDRKAKGVSMNRREMIVGSILGLFWRKPKFRIPINQAYEKVALVGPTAEQLAFCERFRSHLKKRLAEKARRTPEEEYRLSCFKRGVKYWEPENRERFTCRGLDPEQYPSYRMTKDEYIEMAMSKYGRSYDEAVAAQAWSEESWKRAVANGWSKPWPGDDKFTS